MVDSEHKTNTSTKTNPVKISTNRGQKFVRRSWENGFLLGEHLVVFFGILCILVICFIPISHSK